MGHKPLCIVVDGTLTLYVVFHLTNQRKRTIVQNARKLTMAKQPPELSRNLVLRVSGLPNACIISTINDTFPRFYSNIPALTLYVSLFVYANNSCLQRPLEQLHVY